MEGVCKHGRHYIHCSTLNRHQLRHGWVCICLARTPQLDTRLALKTQFSHQLVDKFLVGQLPDAKHPSTVWVRNLLEVGVRICLLFVPVQNSFRISWILKKIFFYLKAPSILVGCVGVLLERVRCSTVSEANKSPLGMHQCRAQAWPSTREVSPRCPKPGPSYLLADTDTREV